MTFFPICRRSSAKTISGVRSKNPMSFFQLIPQRQCCKPINCCFIFRPQFGQTLLLAPIAHFFSYTLLAIQGDKKLPSLKTLQAEQHRLLNEQQRLYDERAKLKKEARIIDTMKANMDDFLKPSAEHASPSIRALDQATLHFMDNCRVVFSFTKKEISMRQGQYQWH